MATYRVNNVVQNWVWAALATTEIPEPPRSGTAYRNPALPDSAYAEGQKFDVEGQSAFWNNMLYTLSSATQTFLNFGISPYEPAQNYSKYAFCLGADGLLYQATVDIPVVAGEDHAPPAWSAWEQKSFGVTKYSDAQYYAKNSIVVGADDNVYIAKEAISPSTVEESHAPPAWAQWKLLIPDTSAGYQENVTYPAGTVIVYNNKLYYSVAEIPPSTAENPHTPGVDPNWKEAGGGGDKGVPLPPAAGYSWFVGGAGALDTNDGLTAQTPVATLKKAFEIIQQTPQGLVTTGTGIVKQLHIRGDVDYDGALSLYNSNITFVSDVENGVTISVDAITAINSYIEFSGKITLTTKTPDGALSINFGSCTVAISSGEVILSATSGTWHGASCNFIVSGAFTIGSAGLAVNLLDSTWSAQGTCTFYAVTCASHSLLQVKNIVQKSIITAQESSINIQTTADLSGMAAAPFWQGKNKSDINLSSVASFSGTGTALPQEAYVVTTSSTIILPIASVWNTVPANPVGAADEGCTVYQIDPTATPTMTPKPIAIPGM